MKRTSFLLALAAALLGLVLLLPPAFAQQFSFGAGAGRPLDPEQAFRIELISVEEGRAVIGWQITDGYYLYRDQISAQTTQGAALEVDAPAGQIKDDPGFGRVEVWYGNASVVLPRAGGDIRVTWQGCQEDGICYAPVTSDLSLPPLPVAASGDGAATAIVLAEGGGLLAGLADRGGAGLVLLAFFGFGMALALTPCVFPMVPILAGVLARQGETLTPARGAVLSGSYVLAMAMAFALMGAVAGWSGQNLQMVLQSPWAVGAVAALFVMLALSNFGLFALSLPAAWTARLSGPGRRGSVGSAATLGFTSALIVGPCVTAPLAGAFLYVAQTGDVVLGAAALFMLGLGQGVPLVIAGTFGASVLPRAGAWMEAVRRLFGMLFLGMAIWLAARILPGPPVLALWGLWLTGAAVLLGALDHSSAQAAPQRQPGRSLGVFALIGAGVMAVGAGLGGDDPLRPLAPLTLTGQGGSVAAGPDFAPVTSRGTLASALADSPARPTLIYVTADWCVTCKGIERSVLPDPQLGATLRAMRLLKLDVTDNSPEAQALMRDLAAAGPPTMIFLDAAQREPAGSRLIGTIEAGDVAASAILAKGGL